MARWSLGSLRKGKEDIACEAVKVLVVVLLGVALAGAATGTAAAQTTVDDCAFITQSGSYEITQDLDGLIGVQDPFCIGIESDDVVLDGNGQRVNSTSPLGLSGIAVDQFGLTSASPENVTIKNVTVTNYDTGIDVENSEDVSLTNVETASTNTGIFVNESTDVTIENARIEKTDNGVDVNGSSDVTVEESRISSTELFDIIDPDPILDPIPPDFPTLDASSVGTQSNGGSGSGIVLDDTQNAVIENNTVSDFEDEGVAVSLGTPSTGSNEIRDNQVINNTEGVVLSVSVATSSPNQVLDNELRGNGLGIGVSGLTSPPTPRNEVSRNELTDNGNGIFVLSEDEDVVDNTVTNSTQVGIAMAATDVDAEENTVKESGTLGIQVQGGSLNDLTDNVVEDNGEAGIKIGGSFNVDNTTLVNNTATGNQTYGIWLSDTEDNELRENTANENNESGIYLNESSGNELRDNTANDNGRLTGPPQFGTYGIWLEDGSNDNELVDNEAFDNGIGGGGSTQSAGIYLGGAAPIFTDPVNNNTVVDNTAGSSQSGNQSYGIWLSRANENELNDNVAENNNRAGIFLDGSRGQTGENTLVNNTARGSEYGIWLFNSIDNDVSESLVENNAEGIAVEEGQTFLSEDVETEFVQGTGNTFTDDVSRNNDWDFVADSLDLGPPPSSSTSSGFPVTNLSIGESTAPDTTLSFNADDVRLKAVDNPEPNPDEENISRYFEAEAVPTGANPFLNVSLSYEDGDVTGVNESTLELLRYNPSAGEWQSVGSSLDTTDNLVSANITTFSDFGAFGEAETGAGGNPFFDQSGNPIDRRMVINKVLEWNNNMSIDGTPYTRREIIDFVIQWNQAT